MKLFYLSILSVVASVGPADALDVSRPGYATFYENGSILGNSTLALCESSRTRYLDREAPRLIRSGDIAADMESVGEIRKLLESHLSTCTHVRVNPTSDKEANYFIAGTQDGWVGAATEAACRAIVKTDGLECGPARIERQ
jgi:hypothetical protein